MKLLESESLNIRCPCFLRKHYHGPFKEGKILVEIGICYAQEVQTSVILLFSESRGSGRPLAPAPTFTPPDLPDLLSSAASLRSD